MSSGGWPAGARHGRHRRESVNAAWTPAVRPSEASHGPIHARLDGTPLPLLAAPLIDRASAAPPPTWPGELLDDPLLEPWREQLSGMDDPWPAGPAEVADDPLDLPPPAPPTVVASLLAEPGSRRPADDDTQPLALVPLPRTGQPRTELAEGEDTLVHSLETPPTGLRKFDLGTVPASVTPPRSGRRAAWFAVGTSAAVVCGLAFAAVQLVGVPWSGESIESFPAYPTRPIELELPETSGQPATSHSHRPESTARKRPDPTGSDAPRPSASALTAGSQTGTDAGISSTSDSQAQNGVGAAGGDDAGTESADAVLSAVPPERITVGPEPVTPTAPKAMGDRTEQYFALVTKDPTAAHALCAGHLATEGPAGIEARYRDVARVEVQKIVIDRNHAVTISTVKVFRKDGTSAVERHRLTFTWGENPMISDETVN
jgi:hypothetical protein